MRKAAGKLYFFPSADASRSVIGANGEDVACCWYDVEAKQYF